MLEQIFAIIRQQLKNNIEDKSDFSHLNIEQTIKDTFSVFQKGLTEAIMNGKFNEIGALFTANTDLIKNPVVDDLVKKLTESLTAKGDLSFKNAFELASVLVPEIINQVRQKLDEKVKGFDLAAVLYIFTGEKNNIKLDELLKNVEEKLGKVDLNELAQKFIADQKENSNKFFDTLSKIIEKPKH